MVYFHNWYEEIFHIYRHQPRILQVHRTGSDVKT